MADTSYKFNIRNTTNDGWINILTETNIAMVDPSNYFLGERLDEVLYELRQAILDVGGGGPGYLGEAVHVIDTNDSTGATDETSSFSTRGGASIAKSLYVGSSVNVTGLTTLNDDTTLNGDLFMIQDISGTVNISGDGTGTITGFTDVTITGVFETTDLLVTSGVTGNFEPKADNTYNLGGAVLKWANLYSTNVVADVITGAVTGNVAGNVTGDLTGNVTGNVTGNLDGDLIATVANAVGILATGDITATTFIGNLTGDVTGDTTGVHTGDVTGDVVGNVIGDLTGDLLAVTTNAVNIVASADIGAIDINASGDLTGNTLIVTNAGSDLIPTSGFNLGSIANEWGTIYANQLLGATNIESGVATIGTLNVTTLIGTTFTGNVTGDVTGDLVGNVTGNIDGNIIGDTTQVTSAWDVVDDADANDSLEVRGGMTVDKNLTVSRNIYTQDLTVTGTLTADTISFSGVMTDLTGNVLSQDGLVVILENGTNGADAVFTGSVTGDLNGNITSSLATFTGLSGDTLITTGEVTANSLNVLNVVDSNLIPLGIHTLGNTLNRWNEVYANTITATSFLGGTFTGNLAGDLTSPVTNAVAIQTTGSVGVGADLDVVGTLTVGSFALSSLTGDLIGDIKSQDGLVTVLDNGTDGSDASFSGSVTGDITGDLNGDLTKGTSVYVTNITGSSSASTGALVVSGGLGVNQNVNIGQALNVSGNLVVGGTFSIGNLTTSQILITGVTESTNKDTGSLVLTNGGLGVEGNVNVGGNLTVDTDLVVTGLSTFTNTTQFNGVVDINNAVDVDITGGNFDVLTDSSIILVGDVVTLTSVGAMSVGADTFTLTSTDNIINGDVLFNNSINVVGDMTVGGSFNFNGQITTTDTTQSISKDTGSIITDGGMGIEKDLFVGGNIYSNVVTATTNFAGNLIGNMIGNVQGDLNGDLVKGTTVLVTNGTPSTGLGIGTLVIQGGTAGPTLGAGLSVEGNTFIGGHLDVAYDLAIGGATNIAGDVTITGDLTVNGTTTTVNSTTVTVADNLLVLNNGEVGTGVTAGTSGIEVDRGISTNYQFLFNEADDLFRIGEVGSLQAVATREDTPIDLGTAVWDATTGMFVTISWETATDAQLLVSARKYLVDNTVSTLTLPATPVQGNTIILHDEDDNWMAAPVTVSGNGNLIHGAAGDLVLNFAGTTVELVYTNSQGWKIV